MTEVTAEHGGRASRGRSFRHDRAAPLVRLIGVTKRYGDVVAVDDLTLTVRQGELFCLLGPSGCGKTTLLRLIAGFEEPSAGRVLLGEQDLSGVPPHRRPVNTMFQSYALFPHMSVAENIAFGLRQDGVGRAERDARVAEMLDLVQLRGFDARRPHQLSGGQRQRVALARALARRPRLLLLDEPLAALDRKLREETQLELMHLQARLGTTFLVVTHDQDEAMTMADRIAVLEEGQVAQLGTPAEIYETPAMRSVARFIGDITLFEGRVVGRDLAHVRVASREAGRELLVESRNELPPGAPVAVGIRPEKVLLHRDAPSEDTPNLLAGTISDVGYLGDRTTYHVALATGAVLRAARANMARRFAPDLPHGAPVNLSFAPDAAILLTS